MQTTTFKGTTVNLSGTEINVGDKAPTVIATGTDLSDITIGGVKDKVQLIITVPSLDTDTCAAETRRFNVDVNNLDICETTVVSMDLPFAGAMSQILPLHLLPLQSRPRRDCSVLPCRIFSTLQLRQDGERARYFGSPSE